MKPPLHPDPTPPARRRAPAGLLLAAAFLVAALAGCDAMDPGLSDAGEPALDAAAPVENVEYGPGADAAAFRAGALQHRVPSGHAPDSRLEYPRLEEETRSVRSRRYTRGRHVPPDRSGGKD